VAKETEFVAKQNKHWSNLYGVNWIMNYVKQ